MSTLYEVFILIQILCYWMNVYCEQPVSCRYECDILYDFDLTVITNHYLQGTLIVPIVSGEESDRY